MLKKTRQMNRLNTASSGYFNVAGKRLPLRCHNTQVPMKAIIFQSLDMVSENTILNHACPLEDQKNMVLRAMKKKN